MYSIAKIEELIILSESTLTLYKQELNENPNSIFCESMVRNTTERIVELKSNLSFEKKRRETEIIDLRLKGKLASVGKLPLDLLGDFARRLADAFVELGRQSQFGNKGGANRIKQIKSTIDLRFEKLMPGSTHIIITGKNNPDLFGNSILESALVNTFEFLNAETAETLLDKSNKVGGAAIKKINKVLSLSVNNELEFDLDWQAPNMNDFHWSGDAKRIKSISNSISKIKINDVEEFEIIGKIITLSLKEIIEIQEGEKNYKINYSLNQLESIKKLQIGDMYTLICKKRSSVNELTGQERISYHLDNIIED